MRGNRGSGYLWLARCDSSNGGVCARGVFDPCAFVAGPFDMVVYGVEPRQIERVVAIALLWSANMWF